MSTPAFTNHLEALRLRVMDRMASLLESQTRSRAFASNLGALVRQVQREVMAELEALSTEDMPHNLALRLRRVIDTYRSLEQTMALLLSERQRQWGRNADHAKTTLLEFNQTVTELASTLIEKDLFERQSRVLERIILSHEHVAQWKAFVQEILADFHAIFPFNFFYIAFAEEHGLSLYLYYLGQYPEDMKKSAREMLSRQMLAGLNLPADTLLEIDEFEITVPESDAAVDDIRMITVAVPEHTPRLAGLLGVAYVGSN